MDILKENIGGVLYFEIAKINEIAIFPKIKNNLCQHEIILHRDKKWSEKINCLNKSEFVNNSENIDQGNIYHAELYTIFPKYTSEINIERFFDDYYIIRLTNVNGDKIIMGDLSHPVIPYFDSTTGRIPSDRNQIKFTFKHTGNYPCPFYPFDK